MHVPARSRSIALALALSAAALALGACMTSHDVISGAWSLVQLDRGAPVADGSLSLLPDGTFTMRPGCNTGGGSYRIEGNRLVTDALNLTMMACDPAVNEQEATFVGVLDAGPQFEVETGTGRLRLTAGDSVLVFESQ